MPDNASSIHMAAPFFAPEDIERIAKELPGILTGQLSMGPHVAAFERAFADRMQVRHAIAVNACTSALEIALASLDLAPDDEVIVPSQTFIATAMAVHLSGARPVFAEIEPDTFSLDHRDVARRITSRTRAIILVHFAGLITPRIADLQSLCRSRNLMLIEDAAHAPGALWNGRCAGSIGDAGCFSFFPTKVMTCGEGGMFTTNLDSLAAFARSMQHRGRDLDAKQELYVLPGRNVRMTELSALLGITQLSRLDEMLAVRRRIADRYRNAFGASDRIRPLYHAAGSESAFWKFPVLLDPALNRDRVMERLHAEHLFVDKAYAPPVHLQPFFRERYRTAPGLLPVTEGLLARHLCLPCHSRLSEADAARVVDTVLRIAGSA